MRQRPVSTLIFGILNIVFGVSQIFGPLLIKLAATMKVPGKSGMSLASDPAYARWVANNAWVGFAFGVVLLVCGIGLLMLANWGRVGTIVYGALDIVKGVLLGIMGYPVMQQHFMAQLQRATHLPPGTIQAAILMMLGIMIVLGLIYPSLLIFFMTRSNVIEACQPEQAAATT